MTDEKTRHESPAAPPLTPRQERFVREYARTGSGKRAAILAGYSPRSAKQIGHSLLNKPRVRQALDSLRQAEVAVNVQEFTPEWALGKLAEEIADPNPRVRLDAKKAVAQALGVFAQKDQQPQECPFCAHRRALEALSDNDLRLVVAGTTRERVAAMSEDQFERWESSVRAEAERWILVARRVRGDVVEGEEVVFTLPEFPAKPDGPSGPAPANR
ncbi:MAG: terminase small subunit [Candidatus Rokubacteria bacterium]|nr:terminase small subunit [Candidatus Rokubacteria bacterium]